MTTSHPEPRSPVGAGEDWHGLARLALAPEPWPDSPPNPAVNPGTLSVRHRERDGVRVLELSGESDIATVRALEAALVAAVPTAGSQETLVVDVSALTFCDVRSATLVLEAGRTVRTSLAGAHGIVERVFDLVDTSRALARCDGLSWATPSA